MIEPPRRQRPNARRCRLCGVGLDPPLWDLADPSARFDGLFCCRDHACTYAVLVASGVMQP